MDTEFEAELLRIIDDVLESDGHYDSVRRCRDSLREIYSAKERAIMEPIERRFPMPPDVPGRFVEQYRQWAGYDESQRVYHEQMPQEKRWFFEQVMEHALNTAHPDDDPEERRRLRLLDLGEFVDVLRCERDEYRQKFGR